MQTFWRVTSFEQTEGRGVEAVHYFLRREDAAAWCTNDFRRLDGPFYLLAEGDTPEEASRAEAVQQALRKLSAHERRLLSLPDPQG